MATPFVRTNEDGQILSDFGKITDLQHYLAELRDGAISAPPSEVATHPNGVVIPGTLSNENDGDLIAVNLTAGQTYTWSYRGSGANGIVDPWLQLLGPDQATLITEDDDGGLGRTSQITYTAAITATYYLRATSWYQIDPSAPAYQDDGDYTITSWSPQAGHDAGSSLATATSITTGTTYAYLDAPFDIDVYKVELTEGMVYTFTYNGGVSGGADWDDEPGESIGVLRLLNSTGGTVIPPQVNYETGMTFVAQQSGTYYVRAEAYSNFAGVPGPEMTGGYTLDIVERPFADFDPLESLNWDSANNVPFVDTDGDEVGDTAYVYFAPAGENFGEKEPDGVTPMTTYGWTDWQIEGVMSALEQYEHILGVKYEITTDVDQATFRMLTTQNTAYGARFYPQDPAYGTQQGIGTFNLISGGFGTRPESLEPGGFSYAVVLHEFGHAHGIAHPHDTGGGSEVMLGVTASTGSYGIYNLNQGVYTVMSYNDAWDFHPDGPTSEHPTGAIGLVIDRGWSETLGAFDIAVLQARYGVTERATGNDTYVINDDYTDASYKTIWDSAGTDAIAYAGGLDAHIDLTAATLDYSPTGGGVVSFVYNDPQPDYTTEIKGGYTIANGVVIENATSGSGDDVLIGNAANNVLTSGSGDDFLMGRGGADKLNGGAGFDTASYALATSGVTASLGNSGSGSGSAGEAAGDKYTGIEALEGSNFDDNLSSGNEGNTLSGLGGDDDLDGGNGNDTLDGGDGNDTLFGGNHNDTLDGGAGDDWLVGGNQNDVLNGGAGNDLLDGGNQSDVLNGGAGDDVMTGGSQNDVFAFSEIGGTDRILDFNRGHGDKIDLSAIDAVAGGSDDAFAFIGSGAFTGVAGQLRAYSQSGQNFVAGDVDGDGVGDFSIQTNLLILTSDLVL